MFESSKFDLRGQTLVSKAQCLRSTRFGVFLGLLALQESFFVRGHSYMTSWLSKGGGGSPKGDTST